MKKNISQQKIINCTLEMIRLEKDISKINFRTIAKNLGCSHTNLYNYFSSFSELLWACHSHLQDILFVLLKERVENAQNNSCHSNKVSLIFKSLLELYLENPGWFLFTWIENIDGRRPSQSAIQFNEAVNTYKQYLSNAYSKTFNEFPKSNLFNRSIHVVNTYLVGEMSNYLLGRHYYANVAEFKTEVLTEINYILYHYLNKE